MADTTAARKAFDLFAQGWATGNFDAYISLLADEMTFWFPMGTHRGKFEGAEGRAQMIAKCQDHTAASDRLTLHPPQFVLTDGSSVMFEFESEGLCRVERTPPILRSALCSLLLSPFGWRVSHHSTLYR